MIYRNSTIGEEMTLKITLLLIDSKTFFFYGWTDFNLKYSDIENILGQSSLNYEYLILTNERG
jgi:hypothetical protein